MIRIFFWLVLLTNLMLFAIMHWGSALMHEDAGSQLQPPLNPEKIKLLGFSAAAQSAVAASAVASAAPQVATPVPPTLASASAVSAPVATPPDSCVEWGEFSGTDLTNATADLAGLKLGSKLTQHEVEHAIGYWIYIPPLKSRAEVNTKISQLKKMGVNEYFVVQENGKWQNAISLGVFKAEDVAKKFLASLKAKGVRSAVLGERQTRLKFTVFTLKNPDTETLAKLTEWQKNFTDIEMKPAACN